MVRGTTVERGAIVVGVVVAGTVVVGAVVLGASGSSPPESPPPSSPGLLGIVVEVGGTVVDGEEACGGLALRRE